MTNRQWTQDEDNKYHDIFLYKYGSPLRVKWVGYQCDHTGLGIDFFVCIAVKLRITFIYDLTTESNETIDGNLQRLPLLLRQRGNLERKDNRSWASQKQSFCCRHIQVGTTLCCSNRHWGRLWCPSRSQKRSCCLLSKHFGTDNQQTLEMDEFVETEDRDTIRVSDQTSELLHPG